MIQQTNNLTLKSAPIRGTSSKQAAESKGILFIDEMTTAIVPYSKTIPLTQGKEAIIGWWWYPFLMSFKWQAIKSSHTYYARHSFYIGKINGKRLKGDMSLHRLILGVRVIGKFVDHKNGNGLDNTEQNIRIADHGQNSWNRHYTNRKSKYIGVNTVKGGKGNAIKYWRAHILNNGTYHSLGCFPYTDEGAKQAAMVYDQKAFELRGEYATLNFPEHLKVYSNLLTSNVR